MATIVRGGRGRPEIWRMRLGLVKNVLFVLAVALALVLTIPGTGHSAVTVARAELSGGTLRIEGNALPNRTITVDGVAMGTSAGDGRFRVERAGFVAPADCTVEVNDGSATPVNTRLSGCNATTPPPPPAAPSLSALTLSQTRVVGGTSVTGTARLTSAAPSGGVVVTLSSDNTAAATVPPSVTVPAGATTASFTVTTHPVQNSQSSVIVGTAGGASRNAVLTVTTQRDADVGSVSLARGGNGQGRITSQPAGIDCTFTATGTTGTCGNVFLPAGTRVRLDARPAQNSSFQGWDFEVSCRNAPEIVIQAGVAHICRPVFRLR
jgi:hypothetical protein